MSDNTRITSASITPTIGADGVPMCNRLCPLYRDAGWCLELGVRNPIGSQGVCIPGVRNIEAQRKQARLDLANAELDVARVMGGSLATELYELRDTVKQRDAEVAALKSEVADERRKLMVTPQPYIFAQSNYVDPTHQALLDRVRVAEAVRDDARRASTEDLQRRRIAEATVAELKTRLRWAENAEDDEPIERMTAMRSPAQQAKLDAVLGGPTLGGEDFVGKTPEERRELIRSIMMGEPAWKRPGLSAAEVRDAIIAEVGMMASARTPEMNAAYAAALVREGKVDSPGGPIHPANCERCNDIGIIAIVTGNNDLPCDCPAGDRALFNTERGVERGAEIKARRRQ